MWKVKPPIFHVWPLNTAIYDTVQQIKQNTRKYIMKIFLSWSGDLSREIARVFQEWLPAVIQTVEPYLSSDSIAKGSRWSHDIGAALESSMYGVICVTRDNITSPWVTFEAGALSKSLSSGKVCPLLVDVSREEVSGPLSQFQNTIFSKDEIFKLVTSINDASGSQAVERIRLEKAYEIWWPELETKYNSVIAAHNEQHKKGKKEQPSSRTFKLLASRGTLINPADQSRNIAFKVETINLIMSSLGSAIQKATDYETAQDTFFSAGYKSGKIFGDRILEKWDLEYPSDCIVERVNRWCEFDSDVGWGRLKNNLTIDEENGNISGSIRLADNFQTYKRSGLNHPDCSLMFGYIKGVLESFCSGVPFSVVCDRNQCPMDNPFKRDCSFEVKIERVCE